MALANNINAAQLASLHAQDAKSAVMLDMQNAADKLQFMKREDMAEFAAKVEKELSALSTSELVRFLNYLAEQKQKIGAKVGPLVSKMINDDKVYPYVTFLSMARAFSAVLALPHSGQGGTTIKEFAIKHPALLKFEPAIQVKQYAGNREQMMQSKIAEAFSKVKLAHPGECGKWVNYKVGETLPEGTPGYVLVEGRQLRQGSLIGKKNFDFVVGAMPTMKVEEVRPMGDWKTCTMVKVGVTIEGFWVGTSTAEKFAGTLTKLCLDCVEPSADIEETAFTGGVLAYEGTPGDDLQTYCENIVKGMVEPISMPQCWSGQETSKGAPTAETSAALTYCLTGKRILKTQKEEEVIVDGQVVDKYQYIWDSEEFCVVQNAISRATIRTVVWGRWIDPDMAVLLKEIHKGSKSYIFVDTVEGDTYFFHQTETRFEIFPGTMETATQKESLSSEASGSMFTELTLVPAIMS
jgi:hypothetical protein